MGVVFVSAPPIDTWAYTVDCFSFNYEGSSPVFGIGENQAKTGVPSACSVTECTIKPGSNSNFVKFVHGQTFNIQSVFEGTVVYTPRQSSSSGSLHAPTSQRHLVNGAGAVAGYMSGTAFRTALVNKLLTLGLTLTPAGRVAGAVAVGASAVLGASAVSAVLTQGMGFDTHTDNGSPANVQVKGDIVWKRVGVTPPPSPPPNTPQLPAPIVSVNGNTIARISSGAGTSAYIASGASATFRSNVAGVMANAVIGQIINQAQQEGITSITSSDLSDIASDLANKISTSIQNSAKAELQQDQYISDNSLSFQRELADEEAQRFDNYFKNGDDSIFKSLIPSGSSDPADWTLADTLKQLAIRPLVDTEIVHVEY